LLFIDWVNSFDISNYILWETLSNSLCK
jgi:hypothetical protein